MYVVCVPLQAGWQTEGSADVQREDKPRDPEEGGLLRHSAAQTLLHSRGKSLYLSSNLEENHSVCSMLEVNHPVLVTLPVLHSRSELLRLSSIREVNHCRV